MNKRSLFLIFSLIIGVNTYTSIMQTSSAKTKKGIKIKKKNKEKKENNVSSQSAIMNFFDMMTFPIGGAIILVAFPVLFAYHMKQIQMTTLKGIIISIAFGITICGLYFYQKHVRKCVKTGKIKPDTWLSIFLFLD